MNPPSVLFYVQHLWGVGHVYRATRVAHALAARGLEVHLVWGGTDVPGFDFSGLHLHRLNPVRSRSADFSELVHADGHPFEENDEISRRNDLLQLFNRIEPDILITEAFPFGRRQMRFELLPLLELAADKDERPMVVASIRDIMQEGRREKRVLESAKWVDQWFDLVLVHGDPNFAKIEDTLQGTEHFRDKIRYSGIVVPDKMPIAKSEFAPDVLVTAGGGAFGRALLETALNAASICNETRNWLVSTGSELPQRDFDALLSTVPDGVKLVRHVENLVGLMEISDVSVSHVGYNTVADILVAGCKSVLYPYTGGRETEQLKRAELLQERGIAVMIGPGEITPEDLLGAVDQARKLPAVPHGLDIGGAHKSAEILSREFEARFR